MSIHASRNKRETISRQIETLPSLCPPVEIEQCVDDQGCIAGYDGDPPFVLTIPKKAFRNSPNGYADFSDSLDGIRYRELYHMTCGLIHHIRLQRAHGHPNIYAFEEPLLDENSNFAGVRWFIYHRRPGVAELVARILPDVVEEERIRLERQQQRNDDDDEDEEPEEIDMQQMNNVARFRASGTIQMEYPVFSTILARSIKADEKRLREEARIDKPSKFSFRALPRKTAAELKNNPEPALPFLHRIGQELYTTLTNMYTYSSHSVDTIFQERGIDFRDNVAHAAKVFSLANAMMHDTKLVCAAQKDINNYYDAVNHRYKFPKPDIVYRVDHTCYHDPRQNLQYTFTHLIVYTAPDMIDLQNHLSSVPDQNRDNAELLYRRAQIRFSQQNRPQGLRESCVRIKDSTEAELKNAPDDKARKQGLRVSAITELSLLLSDNTHYPISFRGIIGFMHRHLQTFRNFNLVLPVCFRDLSIGGNMQAMMTLYSEVLFDVAHLHPMLNSMFQVALYNLFGNDLCSHAAITGDKGTGKSYIQKLMMLIILIADTFQAIGGITSQGMSGGGNQISNCTYFMDETSIGTFKSQDGSAENFWKMVLSNSTHTRLSNSTGNGDGRKAELIITELANTFIVNTNVKDLRTSIDEAIANRFDHFHAQITQREDGSAASRTSSITGPSKKAMTDYVVLSYRITQTLVFLLMLSWKCGANKFPTTYVVDTLWQPFRAIADYYGLYEVNEVRFFERVRHHAIIACCRRVVHLLMFSELRAFDKRVDDQGRVQLDPKREFHIADLLEFDPYLFVTQQDFVTGLTSVSQTLYKPEMEDVLQILPKALFPEITPRMVHGKCDVPLEYKSTVDNHVMVRIRVRNEHKVTEEDVINAAAQMIYSYNKRKGPNQMNKETIVDFIRYCRGDYPHRKSVFTFGDCPPNPMRFTGTYLHIHKDFLFLASRRSIPTLLRIAMTHPFAREETYITNLSMDRKPSVLKTFSVTPGPFNRFFSNGESDDIVSASLRKLQAEIVRKTEVLELLVPTLERELSLLGPNDQAARERGQRRVKLRFVELSAEIKANQRDIELMQQNKVMRITNSESREKRSVEAVSFVQKQAQLYFSEAPVHANPVGGNGSINSELNVAPAQVVLRDLDNIAADERLQQLGLTREEVAARPGFPSILEPVQRAQLRQVYDNYDSMSSYAESYSSDKSSLAVAHEMKQALVEGNRMYDLLEKKRACPEKLTFDEEAAVGTIADDAAWQEEEISIMMANLCAEQEREGEGEAASSNADMDMDMDEDPGEQSSASAAFSSVSSSSSSSRKRPVPDTTDTYDFTNFKKHLKHSRRPPQLKLRRDVSSNSSAPASRMLEPSSALESDSDAVSRMSAPSSPVSTGKFKFLRKSEFTRPLPQMRGVEESL